MSYDSTISLSSSRSTSRPTLPPFLHLTVPQEKIGSSNRLGGRKLTIKNFSRAFHHTVFPRQSGTVTRLEKVAEVAMENEHAICITGAGNSRQHISTGHVSRPSTTSVVSQSTTSHIPTPHSPKTLITSFPPLNVSDIPPRSPTNKSPFSAVLLSGGDEGLEEQDDPTYAIWHAEQLHRARLAKLTRHLGEEVPAELVLSPALLSHPTSRSSVHSRRGGYHHKRRSLDPSSFIQESFVSGSTEGILRRSKSLREHDDTHQTSSITGFSPEMPCTEHIASRFCNAETMTDAAIIPNQPPEPMTAPGAYSTSQTNIPSGNILQDRIPVPMDTYSSSPPPHTFHPPVGTFSATYSHAAPEPRTLTRRPATADTSRREEKLANFFGVAHDDLSVVATAHETTQKLECSSANTAGNFGIGIHESQLEVEVQVSEPTRFWNSRATTKNIHLDDVMDQLRMMRSQRHK